MWTTFNSLRGILRRAGIAAVFGLLVQSSLGQTIGPEVKHVIRLGNLQPAGLAASGVSPQAAQDFIVGISNSSRLQRISMLREEAASAALALSQNQAAPGAVCHPSIQSARAALALARESLSAELELVVAEASASWPVEQSERLRRWRSASADLPHSLRVVEWSPGELRRLLRAVKEERRAGATGTALSGQGAAVLAAARAQPEVVAAEMGLSQNLNALRVLIEQASQ